MTARRSFLAALAALVVAPVEAVRSPRFTVVTKWRGFTRFGPPLVVRLHGAEPVYTTGRYLRSTGRWRREVRP